MASKGRGGKRSTSFKAGQSGNPGGRPREVADVKELARSHTKEAVATLAEVMRDGTSPPAARVRASECLLDRAWGKAETTTNVHVKKDVRDLSTAEILAALASTGVVGEERSGEEPTSLH